MGFLPFFMMAKLSPTPIIISGDTPSLYAGVSPILRVIICPCFPISI